MYDDVGIIDELGKQLAVLHAVEEILQAFGRLEMPDILDAAGGQIVKQDYVVAATEEAFRQMGANETGAAGN
jgi:hypothetical protein